MQEIRGDSCVACAIIKAYAMHLFTVSGSSQAYRNGMPSSESKNFEHPSQVYARTCGSPQWISNLLAWPDNHHSELFGAVTSVETLPSRSVLPYLADVSSNQSVKGFHTASCHRYESYAEASCTKRYTLSPIDGVSRAPSYVGVKICGGRAWEGNVNEQGGLLQPIRGILL